MCTGEWIDTTLSQVITSYPEYYNYDLYIRETDDVTCDELYYLGSCDLVFEKYEKCKVFFTDEKYQEIILEGCLDELEKN
jgi:hypothetical protein